MKYLAIISRFNSTRVITVGLFTCYNTALNIAKKEYKKYGYGRYYVIPMKEDTETFINIHDYNKEYQKYCDICKGESTDLKLINNEQIICKDCRYTIFLNRNRKVDNNEN